MSRQRGSVLMLVPAGVLVLFVLGAISVDSAVAFLGQRELAAAAAAAANDAAGAALSDPEFFGAGGQPGRIHIDEAAARRVAAEAVDRRMLRSVTLAGAPEVRALADDQVCVSLTGTVRPVFARALPGAGGTRTVRARAVATAVQGAGPVRVRPAAACGP